jgi:serine/threonine protein phosphatase 1
MSNRNRVFDGHTPADVPRALLKRPDAILKASGLASPIHEEQVGVEFRATPLIPRRAYWNGAIGDTRAGETPRFWRKRAWREPRKKAATCQQYACGSFRVPAALPPGIRIYAIGDIHGRADLLRTMLETIEQHRSGCPIDRMILVFLGDYVDRGPSSREVLDLLVACGRRHESVFLKGNHESLMWSFLQDSAVLDGWRTCGGLETLVSYGLRPSFNPNEGDKRDLAEQFVRAVPTTHVKFLQSLQLFFICGEFLFVHAGIRPNLPLEKQKERDLLWIREEFLEYEKEFQFFVVHGHTPVREPEIRPNRLNIDTGAFATGRLTCIAIEGSAISPL